MGMNDVTLNGELCLSYPDGFHVLDADEMARVFPNDGPNRWGIWDTERHMIVSVQWHESNVLLAGLVSTKDLARRVAAEAGKAYKSNDYEVGELYQTTLCGEEAWGVSFRYEVSGVYQIAYAIVFKHVVETTNCTYTLSFFEREENAEASEQVFRALLDSLRLT